MNMGPETELDTGSGTDLTRIACLTPSDTFDYTQIFENLFRERTGRDIELDGYKPHRGELPDTYDFDAVLVTGSGYHVYDHQGWEQETEQYLVQALEQEIPVLGVCYGHQIIAETLGGTVEALADTEQVPFGEALSSDREMGYRAVTRTATGNKSTLLEGTDDQIIAFQSHQDYVAELPPNTEPLAANEYGVQAIKSTEHPAYGVQFHPEYDRDMAEELLDNKDLSDDEYEQIVETLTAENERAALNSRAVFDNFLDRL